MRLNSATAEMDSLLEIRRDGARFDILVLNFERIQLFFDNFHKLKNFDPARDRVVVLDCSRNGARERELTTTFAHSKGWALGGPQIVFVRRENWGIDQGARVDYLSFLSRGRSLPRFVWQFQEHYLDTTSDYSRWGAGEAAGTPKSDIIPDGAEVDLDCCERAFEDARVGVVFSNRYDVGVFPHPDGREWFFTDGANLAFRTTLARAAFDQKLLDSYRLVFDASYRWCLYIEFDFCRRLSECAWFDLVRGRSWRDVAEVRAAGLIEELATTRQGVGIESERYLRAFDRYERRLSLAQRLGPAVRAALLAAFFPTVCVIQRDVVQRIRAVMLARRISPPHWLKHVW